MSTKLPLFEELDYQQTPMGELVLQRRRVLELDDRVVHEVRLNSEYLMSSMFYDAEIALSDLGMDAVAGKECTVLVGGLGLGYTAVAALVHENTASVTVVEALSPVIDWHKRGLVPNGLRLSEDSRCTLVEADFFEVVRGRTAILPETFDAILLDIDHSPELWLNPSHSNFYTESGLHGLKKLLNKDGVFAMWSNDAPSPEFCGTLKQVFDDVTGHTVSFPNPLSGGESINGVYVCR